MFLSRKKGQSILEYSLLIGVVVSALLVMQKYIKGSLNNKIQEMRVELNRMR